MADTPTPIPDDVERLRVWLQNIVDIYEIRADLFDSDTECAQSMADRAQCALRGMQYR